MNKPLILVVEDDPPVRNLITTTLKMNYYRYLAAAGGETAILEASSHNPDIVLLDLGLPDMDGVEVIRSIRSWSNLPIIVISARSEDSDKIEALDAGADDYLTKPFSVEELLARLRVSGRAGAAPDAHRVQAAVPARQERGQGADPHLHHPEHLGAQLGQRRRLAARLYGDAAQKAGADAGLSAADPDPYRRGLPDDESGIKHRCGWTENPFGRLCFSLQSHTFWVMGSL